LTKRDLKLNDATPVMHVDPETYTVTADGEVLHCEPLAVLPLAQRYFLF
jgi:urease subunit alpha